MHLENKEVRISLELTIQEQTFRRCQVLAKKEERERASFTENADLQRRTGILALLIHSLTQQHSPKRRTR